MILQPPSKEAEKRCDRQRVIHEYHQERHNVDCLESTCKLTIPFFYVKSILLSRDSLPLVRVSVRTITSVSWEWKIRPEANLIAYAKVCLELVFLDQRVLNTGWPGIVFVEMLMAEVFWECWSKVHDQIDVESRELLELAYV